MIECGRGEKASADLEVLGRGVIEDGHPQTFSKGVVGVHERLAAPEKKRIGTGQVQCSAHGRLEAAPVLHHPHPNILGFPDGVPGQVFVGSAFGYQQQVIHELVFEVRARQVGIAAFVKVAQVARVAAVSAPKLPGGAFEQEHRCARLSGRHRGAQRGIAAADYQDVEDRG